MADENDGSSRKGIGAIIVITIGAIANIVAIAGTVNSWGSSTTIVVGAVPAGATPADATTTSAPSAASTTTAAPKPAETPLTFVDALNAAFVSGDAMFLKARVHPAVIDRYGTATCATYAQGLKNPDRKFVVTGKPSAPGDYTYTTDGMSTVVPDVITVPANQVTGNESVPFELHTAVVDGTYRYFTDCGTPLP